VRSSIEQAATRTVPAPRGGTVPKLAELLDVDSYRAHEIPEKYHIKPSIGYSRFVRGISNAEAI